MTIESGARLYKKPEIAKLNGPTAHEIMSDAAFCFAINHPHTAIRADLSVLCNGKFIGEITEENERDVISHCGPDVVVGVSNGKGKGGSFNIRNRQEVARLHNGESANFGEVTIFGT